MSATSDDYTPLASRFYGALLSLGAGEGTPAHVSMLVPSIVKQLQKQGLTDDQIMGMLSFASAFIDAIVTGETPNPLTIVPTETSDEIGVDTVPEVATV